MANDTPRLVPIGVADTPYRTAENAPHQGFADDAEAAVEVFDRSTQTHSRASTMPSG